MLNCYTAYLLHDDNRQVYSHRTTVWRFLWATSQLCSNMSSPMATTAQYKATAHSYKYVKERRHGNNLTEITPQLSTTSVLHGVTIHLYSHRYVAKQNRCLQNIPMMPMYNIEMIAIAAPEPYKIQQMQSVNQMGESP